LDYDVCPGVVGRETQSVRKSGKQDDRELKVCLSKLGNQLQSVYRIHLVIGYDEVDRLLAEDFKCLTATTGQHYLVAKLF